MAAIVSSSALFRRKITCFDIDATSFVALGTLDRKLLYGTLRSEKIELHEAILDNVPHVIHVAAQKEIALGLRCGIFQILQIRKGRIAEIFFEQTFARPVTSIGCARGKASGGPAAFYVGTVGGNVYEICPSNKGEAPAVSKVINLKSPIVQISTTHSSLLISSERRSLVCFTKTKAFKEIGSKERRGRFGADYADIGGKREIICSRPGCRLWKVGLDGSVNETILLKSNVRAQLRSSDLQNRAFTLIRSHESLANMAVSFDSHCIYLINLEDSTVRVIEADSDSDIIDVQLALSLNQIWILHKSGKLEPISYEFPQKSRTPVSKSDPEEDTDEAATDVEQPRFDAFLLEGVQDVITLTAQTPKTLIRAVNPEKFDRRERKRRISGARRALLSAGEQISQCPDLKGAYMNVMHIIGLFVQSYTEIAGLMPHFPKEEVFMGTEEHQLLMENALIHVMEAEMVSLFIEAGFEESSVDTTLKFMEKFEYLLSIELAFERFSAGNFTVWSELLKKSVPKTRALFRSTPSKWTEAADNINEEIISNHHSRFTILSFATFIVVELEGFLQAMKVLLKWKNHLSLEDLYFYVKFYLNGEHYLSYFEGLSFFELLSAYSGQSPREFEQCSQSNEVAFKFFVEEFRHLYKTLVLEHKKRIHAIGLLLVSCLRTSGEKISFCKEIAFFDAYINTLADLDKSALYDELPYILRLNDTAALTKLGILSNHKSCSEVIRIRLWEDQLLRSDDEVGATDDLLAWDDLGLAILSQQGYTVTKNLLLSYSKELVTGTFSASFYRNLILRGIQETCGGGQNK